MSPSPSRLASLAVLGLAVALGAWAVGPPPPDRGPNGQDAPPDPFPLRRVLLPADRLPAELKRVKDGALTRMPRVELEALVRQAGRAVAAGRSAPRLVEARYSARLTDSGSLSGTARWKVHHGGAGPAL